MAIVCSEAIEEKILSGQRLSREEGLWLWQRGELLELAQLANRVRFRRNPEPKGARHRGTGMIRCRRY